MQQDEYRKLAITEDNMWYFHVLWRRVGIHLDLARPNPTKGEALDAGCGTGGFINYARGRWPGLQWAGLDYVSTACEWSRQRTGLPITQGSVEALPFGESAFDCITCLDVLTQVDDDALACRELARCLRPGGITIVTSAALPWLWSYHDEQCMSRRRYRAGELGRLLRTAGLRVEFESSANLFALPMIAARRRLWPSRTDKGDMRTYPAPLEAGMRALGALENAWLKRWPLPLGSSVFVVARRPR